MDYKNVSSPNYKKLNFFAQSNGLSQHIKTTTRNTETTKSLIDLVLSNSKFVLKAGTLDHFISDHQPIYVVHKKGRDERPKVRFQGRSYRKFDRDIFKELLAEMGWEDFYSISDPEEAWNYILERVTPVLDKMCPLKHFYIKNYRPDWMSDELIEQIKDRDYFYRRAKKTGDKDSWNVAKYLRNLTNSNIRQAKRAFILRELRENENNCKKFWKIIREEIPSDKASNRRDIILHSRGNQIQRENVAHFINDYFINIGKVTGLPNGNNPDDSVSDLGSSSGSDEDLNESAEAMWSLDKIREVDVYKVVKDINISKSSGLENISSFIVKELFKALVPEVTYMFNLSVATSSFPIPIPKTGNLTLVKNYRPISLLPLPGKILEKLVHSQLSSYLEDRESLNDAQHGFRKDHSTVHSIAQLTKYINVKMDSATPTMAVFVDFRKAFDCVQHDVLLTKLSNLNLDCSVVQWVKSYLALRKQRVLANNVYSDFLKVTQGVPQGSVLGPLFYIIYTNDLTKHIQKCKVALYADDTVLYVAHKDPMKSISALRHDVGVIANWCKVNGIQANTDKTRVMTFGNSKLINAMPPPPPPPKSK